MCNKISRRSRTGITARFSLLKTDYAVVVVVCCKTYVIIATINTLPLALQYNLIRPLDNPVVGMCLEFHYISNDFFTDVHVFQ